MPVPITPQNRWETDFEAPLPNEPGIASAFRTLVQRILNRTERLRHLVETITGRPFDNPPSTSIEAIRGRVDALEASATRSYVHAQTTPQAEWIVNHGLGYKPSVSVYTLGGVEVEAEVVHISDFQLRVRFGSPQTGYARCV
jgi:hypothetical protein